jgi:hypothetical protein
MTEQVTEFSRQLFEPFVGRTFELVDDGERVPVLLRKLVDKGGSPHTTMFSLLFVIPPGGPTEQGLYRLECPGLGAVDLLLVPIRAEEDSLVFEAAMNLLGSSGE